MRLSLRETTLSLLPERARVLIEQHATLESVAPNGVANFLISPDDWPAIQQALREPS